MLTLQFVRSPKYAEKSSTSEIDWAGIGLLAVFVGSLQYIFEKGQEDDWFNSDTIVILTVMSVLGAFFFIWREITYRNPVVQLKVLKNGNLRIGTILSFIMGFGLYGSTFIIPLYTQSILGLDSNTGRAFICTCCIDYCLYDAIDRTIITNRHQTTISRICRYAIVFLFLHVGL